MVIFEMRDSAYDAAFDLLEEAKHSAKKTKLTLCELEDAMYDCYESIKEENSEDYYEPEMDFRGRSGMRSNYRHDEYGVREDEDDDMPIHSGTRRYGRRRGMRMRSGMRRGY
jgi:hypothetical protein